MTIDEFEEKFIEDGEVKLPQSAIVYEDESIEHKLVISTVVWEYFGQFFEVTYTKDNSGYWRDGESYPPTVAEVFPKEVTVTKYVTKEDNADKL